MENSVKLTAKVKLTLTKRTVDALEPEDKPWIAWDDKLTGFGVRVHPSGAKSYVVNYRAGNGGRKAPNKRVVVGRAGRATPDQARRRAQELLGRVAAGEDPAGERTEARGLPRLGAACEDYIESGHDLAASTERGYRRYTTLYLGDWLSRPLDGITRRDVEGRFRLLTERHGPMPANQCLSFLRSVYRRPCVDYEGLHNPVEQWLAAGGRYHRKTRKRISSPAEVLPCWRTGMDAAVPNPVHRDVLLFGLYTGMRRGEIMALRWEDVNLEAGLFRVEETKTGVPLELPVTRQLGKILARRRAEWDTLREQLGDWVFPSRSSESGHVEELHRHYEAIGRAGGAKFWFHALRNCFITVAERELMLPRSLTKRLVNHARPNDVTEGYAADWTVGQLREPAQRVADRIDELTESNGSTAHLHAPAR
ncbi:MAG: integrase family protein [Deltaproteobacteria bacterium]|nr:integrase family protein [Deltaproteobacteria bacterium]